MRPLSAHTVLRIWERGERQHPIDRALTILAEAFPEATRDELAVMPIGERDRRLLQLYESTFGLLLPAYAECPQCSEQLEFTVPIESIRQDLPPPDLNGLYEFKFDDVSLRFRLLTSRDLADVAYCDDPVRARALLLEACISQATRSGIEAPWNELPEELLNQLTRRMAECDPQADTLIELCCPACKHQWSLLFDIASYLWVKIAAIARRLLLEVHTLARAYGWREADILAMSARRRELYLQMVS